MVKPIEDILPREMENKDIESLLAQFSNGIEEVVNFGTHVIQWELNEAKGGDENIPIAMILRNILDMLDATSILVKSSSIDPCKALLRTTLESFFGLEYILESDTKSRALAFLVCHYQKELKMLNKLDPHHQSNVQLKHKLQVDRSVSKSGELPKVKDVKNAIENVNRILALPIYKETLSKYTELQELGIKSPKWYNLYSKIKNIDQLASYLNRQYLYEIMYRFLSEIVHGSDIIQGKLINTTNKKSAIVQLRYVKDAQYITLHAMNFGLLTFQVVTEKRLVKYKKEYAEWYLTIRKLYQKLANVRLVNMS
jgi:hypothetical protein